ncbi:Rv3235 family protein [Streptomyces sp. NPDC005774]|uniref:Rv3235 family protein n=1 Tax=Streptomyces sp. NPDC005774 TaxID=3364728 RepID=UPI0036935B80
MNKVMTRTQHRTGTRPPGRRDTRRPTGTTPPRIPAGGTALAPPPGEGPPSPSPGATSTRPTDNRPPSFTATTPAAPGRPRPLPLPVEPAQEASVRAARAIPARAPRPAAPRAPRSTAPRPPHLTAAPAPLIHPASAPAVPRVPVRAPRRPVPQPRPTDHFAELLLAVLSGQRPVHSMLRHTVGRAYDELADLAERGPLRTRGTRPVVRDIGYYVPREGALEVFARIGAGDRLRAMAFRLEQGHDLRWRCTAVELGGPRPPRPHDR